MLYICGASQWYCSIKSEHLHLHPTIRASHTVYHGPKLYSPKLVRITVTASVLGITRVRACPSRSSSGPDSDKCLWLRAQHDIKIDGLKYSFRFPLHIWEEKEFPLSFHQQLLPLKILNNCKWGSLFFFFLGVFGFPPFLPCWGIIVPQKNQLCWLYIFSSFVSHTHTTRFQSWKMLNQQWV